jgi:hypothetical protein
MEIGTGPRNDRRFEATAQTQRLHIDLLTLAEPFGVVAEDLHRNGFGRPQRQMFLFLCNRKSSRLARGPERLRHGGAPRYGYRSSIP